MSPFETPGWTIFFWSIKTIFILGIALAAAGFVSLIWNDFKRYRRERRFWKEFRKGGGRIPWYEIFKKNTDGGKNV